jgi:hypothetical protein
VTESYSVFDRFLHRRRTYPQHIMIEFTQDKCDLLNNYSVGETVKLASIWGENGLVLRAKLNISIVFKAGELRKQGAEPQAPHTMPTAQTFARQT